mgnify:CR=1 FL=1
MIFHRFGYRNRGANRARLSRKTFVESIVDQYGEEAFHSIKTEVPAMSAKKQVRHESAKIIEKTFENAFETVSYTHLTLPTSALE